MMLLQQLLANELQLPYIIIYLYVDVHGTVHVIVSLILNLT